MHEGEIYYGAIRGRRRRGGGRGGRRERREERRGGGGEEKRLDSEGTLERVREERECRNGWGVGRE